MKLVSNELNIWNGEEKPDQQRAIDNGATITNIDLDNVNLFELGEMNTIFCHCDAKGLF